MKRKTQLVIGTMILLCNFFSSNTMLAGGTHNLMITEFMSRNSHIIADEDSDYSDWLEIYNPGALPINLLNWRLTDKSSEPAKWVFPSITIESGQYIVIFASGKDRRVAGSNLHTNFKISENDDFLALIEPDGLYVSDYYENIPEQFDDISYGILNGTDFYFDKPTPGAANMATNYVPPAKFSVIRGIYSAPFNVVLNTELSSAYIRYTTNGSYPDSVNGILYTAPVYISKTTPLRAIVYNNSYKSINTTHTYVFLNDIKVQNNTPEGYPTTWGKFYSSSDTAKADYEMDSEVVNNSIYSGLMDTALRSIPTVSVVTNIGYLFSKSTDPYNGGIYIHTGPPIDDYTYGLGYGWARPASLEYFDINRITEFFENCRLELHGGHSRRAEKNPKHSFNLEFKAEYGNTKLKKDIFKEKGATEEFDALILRGGFNNTWLHSDASQRTRGMYIHDSWMKDSYIAMGEKTTHNKFVHLYLNGIYWGLYNISERLDKDFMESYFNGSEDDFDIIKDYTEVASGSIDAWNAMMSIVNSGLSTNADYFRLQGKNADGTYNTAYPAYVDVDNLIDYMLLNIYGGNTDWDHHNWTASRNRIEPGKGFKFFIWDAEHVFEGLNDNVVEENNTNCPSNIYAKLRENVEFRLEFADHVNKHLFANGDLTPAKVMERWMKRFNEINYAIICESARWGDYRKDVYPSSPYALYTRNNQWITEQNRLLNIYFPARTQIVIDQLKAANLYPSVVAPSFSWYGKKFITDTTITISAPAGTIYYTIDGSDPRLIGGGISLSATVYSGTPINLTDTTTIKARVKSGSDWSAVTKADYEMIPLGTPTEIKHGTYSNISVAAVYPNPCKEFAYFIFQLTQSGDVDISIYALNGKFMAKVFEGPLPDGVNTISWLPGNLKPGLYLYRINNKGTIKTGKLLISD